MSRIAKLKELISPESVIQYFGGRFSHQRKEKESWWFREGERTASIKLDHDTGKIHDFGKTNGKDAHGDLIDYWIDNKGLTRDNREDRLKAYAELEEFAQVAPPISLVPPRAENQPPAPKRQYSDTFRIERINKRGIKAPSLLEELRRRDISPGTARACNVQEAYLSYFSKKRQRRDYIYGFVLENDKGGYAASIPNPLNDTCFKTNIGPAGVTTLLSRGEEPDRICLNSVENRQEAIDKMLKRGKSTHVVEGMWDLMTLAEARIPVNKCLRMVTCFLDNDAAGEEAMHDIAGQLQPQGWVAHPGNDYYAGFKDLSLAWQKNRGGVYATVRKNTPSNEQRKVMQGDAAEALRDRSPTPPRNRYV